MNTEALKKILRSSLLLVLIACCGCGGQPRMAPPEVAEVSGAAKAQIKEFIDSAKKNPKQAGTQCQMLMESVEAYARDYGDSFKPVHDVVKELNDLYSGKAEQSVILEKLQSLEDALGKLP